MEFPNLGKQCNEQTCKQLDFLPMKCDACSKIFCRDHIQYTTHNCQESYKKDNQVPVCPLCNSPIPVKKGDLPDFIVGRHIDNDCQSDTAKQRRKVYTNKCSFKHCKQKELIPVKCGDCHQNFCLRHRHPQDHSCKGFQNTGRGVSNAGAAAIMRFQQNNTAKPSTSRNPQQTSLSSMGRDLDRQRQERSTNRAPAANSPQSIHGGLSEDEALARAIQLSMAEEKPPQTTNSVANEQELEDEMLARALQASQQEVQHSHARQSRGQQQQSQKSTCSVS